MKLSSWSLLGRLVLAIIGLALCCGVVYFLATGYDEVLTNANVRLLALGLAGLLSSVGAAALWFAATRKHSTSRVLDAAVYLSAVAVAVGVFNLT